MKTALVTGASSGIGLGICISLSNMNYKVYGIGRDFSKVEFNHDNFIKITCDLTNHKELLNLVKKLEKDEELDLLINNAGVAYFGLHEDLNPSKIHEMISTNIEAPLIITNLFLRKLKKNKGTVINISSITAKRVSPHGCAYGATKAALSHFSDSLFDEVRKTGVKVAAIHPDIAKTNFYRNADFKEGPEEDAHLTVDSIVNAVEFILNADKNAVVTDITIRPQKNRIERKK